MGPELHPLTLTHARLRRSQGDVSGAIAILEAMIDAGEEGDELWRLYVALGGEAQRPHREPSLPREEAPSARDGAQLSRAFRKALGDPRADPRVARLRRWLDHIREDPA